MDFLALRGLWGIVWDSWGVPLKPLWRDLAINWPGLLYKQISLYLAYMWRTRPALTLLLKAHAYVTVGNKWQNVWHTNVSPLAYLCVCSLCLFSKQTGPSVSFFLDCVKVLIATSDAPPVKLGNRPHYLWKHLSAASVTILWWFDSLKLPFQNADGQPVNWNMAFAVSVLRLVHCVRVQLGAIRVT